MLRNPAPIARNKRREKLGMFEGQHKAEWMSKARAEERLVVVLWAVASALKFILRTVWYQGLSFEGFE